MQQRSTPEQLFKLLQSAITRKLRSLTQTDEIRLWEQGLRRYGLEVLVQQSDSNNALRTCLESIHMLEKADGIKLAVLLEQLSEHVSKLKDAALTYPLALLQAIMLKPMNVQAAWTLLSTSSLTCQSEEQSYCIEIIKAELLSALGRQPEAYQLLKPLLQKQHLPIALRLSGSLRYARLAKSRDTLEAEKALLDALALIENESPQSARWRTEFAECAQELASLHVVCGKHHSAMKWGQKSLDVLDHLQREHPERIDLQLLRATCLRTLAIAERELEHAEISQKLFSQAIAIIESLVTNDPQDSQAESELPRNHDVLGDIHLAKLDLERALHEYSASAAISAHLAFRDPMNVRWRQEEINSGLRIATVLKKTGHTLDSLNLLHAYQSKLQSLMAQDPGNVEYHAAHVQMNIQIGDLHWTQQLHDQAAEDFREAFGHVNQALSKDPYYPRWMLLHLLTLQRLAEVEFSRGDLEAAARTLHQAHNTIAQALKNGVHKKKLRQFFVAVTTRLSDCSFAIGKTSAAMAVQNEALQLAAHFQRESPDSLAWVLLSSSIQTQTAKQKLRLGLLRESQSLWEAAITILSKLREAHPDNIELTAHLVRALLVKVEWLCQSEQWAPALALSTELRDQLLGARAWPTGDEGHQALLCDCLQHLAYCCHRLNLQEQEFQTLQSLEKMRKESLQTNPQSAVLQNQCHAVQLAIGKAMLKAGHIKSAVAYLNEALKGFNALHERQKKHPEYLLAIGEILINMGQAYALLENPEATQLVLSKALLVAGWLGQAGQENYAMRLAAAQLLLAVAQSPFYAHSQKVLLEMATAHAVFLQATTQNPAVERLSSAIENLQEKA